MPDIPGFQPPKNPFEQVGLTREFVEAIVELDDPDAIRLVLKGFQRAVSRGLHPDRNAGLAGQNFYTDFMRGYDELSSVPDEDLATLARGYAKARSRGRAPQKQRGSTERVGTEYIRDGSLLASMSELVLDTGESIASTKGFDILVAPKAYLPNSQKEVFDDKTVARTTVVSVTADGKVSYQNYSTRRFSEGMDYESNDYETRDDARKEKLLPISADLNEYLERGIQTSADLVSPEFAAVFDAVNPHQYPSSHTNEMMITVSDDDIMDAFTIEGRHVAHLTTADPIYQTLQSGRYYLLGRPEQFKAGESPRFVLRDDYKSIAKQQPNHDESDLLVVGTLDTEYLQYQTDKFRGWHGGSPGKLGAGLPGAYRPDKAQIPLFPLAKQDYARAEGVYSPHLRHKELLLVVNQAGELSVAGTVLEFTRKSLA